MKKKIFNYFFIFIFVSFSFLKSIHASNEYVVFLDAVNIRTGPGTNYERLELGQVGSTYNLKSPELIKDANMNGSCDNGWYNIDVNGNNAYVCSTYVRAYIDAEEEKTEPTNACEIDLKNAGFPASYWGSLCSLKSKFPNWQFKAIETKLDFATAVDKFTSCGDSLLYNPKSSWRDNSCSYNEGGYVTANQSAVAYYLDPRNFLTETYIFQFENNRYNPALENSYASVARSIISGADFYKYHQGIGNDLASLLASAGKETNINPVHLASRMYQELGTGTRLQNLYKGIFNGDIQGTIYDFRGYYNFYNIGVTGYCVTKGKGATYCGLTTAQNQGWNNVYAGVKGGGTFLNSDYVGAGQYTSYLERFNVVPTTATSIYLHYYMANMQAPSSEAQIAYNAYKKNDILNSAFEFDIPVYNNMNTTIENNNSGAVDSGGYTNPSSSSAASILTSAGLRASGNNVLGVKPNTSADTVKNTIEAISGAGTVVITNASGNAITRDLIGTGSKITITTSNATSTFTVIIKGDTSGDGVINALDLLQVQKSILGTYTLKDIYKLAGDPSGDGVVNALDLLQVQKSILGTYTIVQ